jgi:FixJ family two-component response regulator
MPSTGPCIAVVDDEADLLVSMQRLLRSQGFAVTTYPSGEAFLAAVDAHCPQCLLLDLHMPGLSGFDVQAKLAETHRSLPVIILTGHDSASAEQRAMAAGAVGFLRKPADGGAILAMIVEAIGAHTR